MTPARGVTVTFTLAGAPKPQVYENFAYQVWFTRGEKLYRLGARLYGDNPVDYALWVEATTVGGGSAQTRHPVTGSIDLARKTLTATAPASLLGNLRKGRAVVVQKVMAHHGFGTGYGNADAVVMEDTIIVAGARCGR